MNSIDKIQWRTKNKYVDLETGEEITETQAKQQYIITHKKKHRYVYKTTGITTITNECRHRKQITIQFE